MKWDTVKGIFVRSKVFGIEIKGVWGEGNIPMSPLNNFSDFLKKKKIAIFVTLKKITHLNFPSTL